MLRLLEFKGLIDWFAFKHVFSNRIILEDLVDSFFKFIKLNKKLIYTNITKEYYHVPNKQKFKGYLGDILGVLDTKEIIILNTFTDKLSKHNFATNTEFLKLKPESIKVINLVFVYGSFHSINNKRANPYDFRHLINRRLTDKGNTETFFIRLDLVENYCHSNKEDRFIRWLRIINARTIDEIKEYAKGDEIMEEAMIIVNKWCRSTAKTGLDSYLNMLKQASSELATTKKAKEVANELLKAKININDIAKYTNLPKKEIAKIKKGININYD